MDHNSPDGPPGHEFPLDTTADEMAHSNGRAPDDQPEQPPGTPPSESGRSTSGGGDDLPPMPPLGLPDQPDPRHIPKLTDLQRAAINALHRETAFVIMHQDEPDVIVERLDELAEIVRAAIGVKGDHLEKAVRLGLALKSKYWLKADKFKEWMDLLSPLLTTAIQIEEFQAEVYRYWSLYRHVGGKIEGAEKALAASREYAAESGREDLVLLARSDQFNLDATAIDLDDARNQASELIRDARRLGYDFVHGRVYFSLARAYEEHGDYPKAFEYSQQALVILAQTDSSIELTGEALTFMLGVLGATDTHSPAYQAALWTYFESIVRQSGHPISQAAMYFLRGRDQYYRHDQYDDALRMLLLAWRTYRQINWLPSITRCWHMLGMIQTKRHRWAAAEYYFRKARERYEQAGEKSFVIQVLHAWAFIPYEFEDWELALARLKQAYATALEFGDQVPQIWVDGIQDDIKDVEQNLSI